MKRGIISKRIIQYVLKTARAFLTLFIKFQEVSILVYHSVSDICVDTAVTAATFEEQMNFLKRNGYYFATLAEVISYINGEKRLPLKTIAITIDDGYADSYQNVFPVLKKFKIPATIFIVSDFEKMAQPIGSKLSALSEIEKGEMKKSGLVDFQSHSATHVMLDSVDGETLGREMIRGDYVYFAYPGGHYNQAARDGVKKAGYSAAFTIKPGLVRKGDDLFSVKRNVILGSMSDFDFKVRLTTVIDWYTRAARAMKKLS